MTRQKRSLGRPALAGWVGPALAFLAAGAVLAAPSPTRIVIVSRGQSPYVIVVPDGAKAAPVGQAARLLQETLREASGAKLPVVRESAAPRGAPAFYLGKSRAARNAGLPLDDVKGWAYRNKTIGRNVFLVGDDARKRLRDRRTIRSLGALKAVTAFLEDQLGVRFVLPGKYGIVTPKLDRVTVDADMDKSWKPVLDFVVGRSPGDVVYAAANNFIEPPGGVRTLTHSYNYAVPTKVYGKAHPEYFILRDGERTSFGNHLCISNPDVQELMLKEMERRFDLGYAWVDLGQTDGYRLCECAACAAIDPDPGERTWIVHRKLAAEMRKRRPGRKVMILAYGPTKHPPKTFGSFPDNVVIEMCSYTPKAFAEWARFRVPKTVYIYTFYTPIVAPKGTPRGAVDQVRRFAANDVRGIYFGGGLSGRITCWGLLGPAYYAYGKALGDPRRDPDALFREYVDAAFGAAAAPMRAFYKAMYDRLDTLWQMPPGVRPFATPEDYFCHFFPPKRLKGMALNLARAKAVARDKGVKARLRYVEMEFEYVRRTAAVFQFYRTYRLRPIRETFDLLADAARRRREYIDWLYPPALKGRMREVAGLLHERPPLGMMTKAYLQTGGKSPAAPLNWDFDLLRRKGTLPGVASRRRVCPRVERIVLDGKLDDPAWRKARFQELGEIGMGALKNGSRFKVVYDGRSIYFGVECDLDDLRRIDAVRPVGRDGQAYRYECVEIMLDPFGARERYCHFILNPAPNSTYDRRFGYIDDPLHPLYSKLDSSWNGKWAYATKVDRKKMRWTAEVRIPFTTLEAEPPTPGAVWTMNLGREEWPKGPGVHPPAYSLWSPNLETRTFHDPEAFGEVLFR